MILLTFLIKVENDLFYTKKNTPIFPVSSFPIGTLEEKRGYRYIQGSFSNCSRMRIGKNMNLVSIIKINNLQRFSSFPVFHPYRVGFPLEENPTYCNKILCKVSVILLCKLNKIMSKISRSNKQNAVWSYNPILSNLGCNWLSKELYAKNRVCVYILNLISLELVFYAK